MIRLVLFNNHKIDQKYDFRLNQALNYQFKYYKSLNILRSMIKSQ